MNPKAQPSVAAVAEAEALIQELKPTLVEMIERNDPTVRNLSFNDIEGNSAAVGDLLAKLLMVRALGRQAPVTPEEEQAAREAAFHKAPPQKQQRPPEDLQMTRIPKRKLKTARGEITFAREYLHFLFGILRAWAPLRWAVRRDASTLPDFGRVWYTPPLGAHQAWEVEARQLADGLGLNPLVSLTDHDAIDAPLSLRPLEPTRDAPISVEWMLLVMKTTAFPERKISSRSASVGAPPWK